MSGHFMEIVSQYFVYLSVNLELLYGDLISHEIIYLVGIADRENPG